MPIKRIDLKETTQYTLIEYETALASSDPAKVASQVGEIVIDTGGNPNNPQLYIANAQGFLNPVGGGGGNGSPGGLNTQLQYNNGGLFGGISGMTSNGVAVTTSNANLKITGGITGQFLQTDGTGNLIWANAAGGNTTPGGLNTQLQFNNNGAFGGITGITSNGVSITTSNANIKITGGTVGQVLTTDGTGNLSWAAQSANGTGQVFVTSNITSLQAGQPLLVNATYGNVTYPGGVFTIYQTGVTPPGLTITDVWAGTGTSSKQKYSDIANLIVNTQNINLTLSLSNTTFNVQSTDVINIGASAVTGANLLSLGISGTGGTYSIPAAFFSSTIQTANSTTVTASLSTANGTVTGTGTTLTTAFPGPASISVTDQWASGGTVKTAYTDFPNLVVNTQNVTITINAANTSLQPISSDYITIGSSNVTGANLLSLGINSAGGTYNIPASYLSPSTQTSPSSPVFVSLTGIQGITSNSGVTLQTTTPSITMTDQWASGGTSKQRYSNIANGLVNTQNVSVTFNFAFANAQIQNTDDITFTGTNVTSVVTGANLQSLSITGNGTFNIPSSFLNANIQIDPSIVVTSNLTTNQGKLGSTGNTLTTFQTGNAFSIAGVTGSFANLNVGYWEVTQPLNWAITGINGTITGGTVIANTPGGNITLTSNAALANSGSANIISDAGPITIIANLTGIGTNGTPGNANASSGNVTLATSYVPLFSKITTTGGNANPNFTTNDTHYNNNFAIGQGANTDGILNNWLWMAIPTPPAPVPPTLKFKFDFPPFIGVTGNADQIYNNVSISGQNYSLYGFTRSSGIVFLYTSL